MKVKKIVFVALALFLLSSSFIVASDNVSSFLFKGKLFQNNKELTLKQDMYSINGSIYVPIRAITESMNGQISYDKDNQIVYVEQAISSNKKSEINKKVHNDSFTLQVFSSKEEYSYGDPIEIWARLSNHTNQTINIAHGEPLIEYSITDEDGFTSKPIYGFPLYFSTFHSGDELNSSLKLNDFLYYNIHKQFIEINSIDVHHFLNNSVRPSLLPQGNYVINVSSKYSNEDTIDANYETLELSIPLVIN